MQRVPRKVPQLKLQTPVSFRAPDFMHSSTFALLGGMLLALTSCSSNAHDRLARNVGGRGAGTPVVGGETLTFDFDDGSGSVPEGWQVGTSNRREGSDDAVWECRSDATAPSSPRALVLTDARDHVGQAFNLCWNSAVSMADIDIEVAVHTDGGVEDQGGGPAWRIGGENDYYAARWNPLEDNFRVYSIKAGERLQLGSARVRADTEAWHTIRVRHVGDSITCWFDGEELLHATDTKLMEPGGIGLWTKADATTRFDNLSIAGAASDF